MFYVYTRLLQENPCSYGRLSIHEYSEGQLVSSGWGVGTHLTGDVYMGYLKAKCKLVGTKQCS
jgi:hypothetical protein